MVVIKHAGSLPWAILNYRWKKQTYAVIQNTFQEHFAFALIQ